RGRHAQEGASGAGRRRHRRRPPRRPSVPRAQRRAHRRMSRADSAGAGRARHRFRGRDAGGPQRGGRDSAEAVRARRAPHHREPSGARARSPMSATAVRNAQEYEDAYRAYFGEAAEEFRAVRVGEKETSEQAAIVARHADLFTREQLYVLRAAEEETSDPDERERLYRLRRTCEGGIVDAELAAREDELANALLAARLTFD